MSAKAITVSVMFLLVAALVGIHLLGEVRLEKSIDQLRDEVSMYSADSQVHIIGQMLDLTKEYIPTDKWEGYRAEYQLISKRLLTGDQVENSDQAGRLTGRIFHLFDQSDLGAKQKTEDKRLHKIWVLVGNAHLISDFLHSPQPKSWPELLAKRNEFENLKRAIVPSRF